MVMKVKVLGNEKGYLNIKDLNFVEDEEDAEFILIRKEEWMNTSIKGLLHNEVHVLNQKDILYFESDKEAVYAVTKAYRYLLNEKLYELEQLVNQDFFRISKSVIVNIQHINKIKPSLNRKFSLTIVNGDVVDVTRTYYLLFKELIGI